MHVWLAAAGLVNAFDDLWREDADGDILRDYGFAFAGCAFEVDAHVSVVAIFVRVASGRAVPGVGGRAECGEWCCVAAT